MKRFLKINPADNVAVALDLLRSGETIEVDGVAVTLQEDIENGHKFALRDLKQGENVIKYGYAIGHALTDIVRGAWVHTHNLKTNLHDDQEYTYQPAFHPIEFPISKIKI